MLILAGDIGGTKSLFGLFDDAVCLRQRRLANADFPDFEAVFAAALAGFGSISPQRTCLALAGPIADGGRQARLTNLPWHVDAAALEHRFDLPRIALVNDFAAAALGAVTSEVSQRISLQAGTPQDRAPHLVVGAGTGLGMAVVLPERDGWRIVPGEGGHVAFAPADAEQLALWTALHTEHGRVTWERVVSGPGLEFIYRFICQRDGVTPETGLAELAAAPVDSAAGRAVDLFLRCYGAYAGDMAMTVLPRSGVHLAGGIAGKMLSAFSRRHFLTAFNAKAEHAALAQQMPIDICIDPALGLCGAAQLAMTIA